MRTIVIFLFSIMNVCTVMAQNSPPPDKVQYQSVRIGADVNSNYQGAISGAMSRVYIGYHIDQAKSWGISPFVNGGAYFLSHLFGTDSQYHNAISPGGEPGLLSGYQNDKIGIKLLTSIHLIFNKYLPNGMMVVPQLGLCIGNGLHPIGKKLEASAYAAIAPFQGGSPGYVFGINIGWRLRPITYVRVAP